MKISKKATQMNVQLNSWRYTQEKIIDLLEAKKIFWFDDDLKVRHNIPSYPVSFRVSTNDLKEIKVALDPYGCYTAVAVSKNKEKFYITI